jgi:hypothetical protein
VFEVGAYGVYLVAATLLFFGHRGPVEYATASESDEARVERSVTRP